MAEKYNRVHDTSGIADSDLSYSDMPGSYIDDVLASELPGSHLDNLLYGELPGSHLDVVLKSPLPGGSTDELLNSPLPGGLSYGIDSIGNGWKYSGMHNSPEHSHMAGRAGGAAAAAYESAGYSSDSSYRYYDRSQGAAGRTMSDYDRQELRERLEEKRRAREEEKNRKEFLDDLEQTSFAQAQAAQNRINRESRRGLDDLDSLWNSIRKNTRQNRTERKQWRAGFTAASIPTGTLFSRAGNSSTFVRDQIRKEKPRKMGIVGAFVTMILLITLLNRVIIPLVSHFSSTEVEDTVENVVDDGGVYLTDEEFNSLYNLYDEIAAGRPDCQELFELSDEEFAEVFEKNGFETDFDKENGFVLCSYAGATTWVNVYRNGDYITFSSDTVSDNVDRDVIEKALDGVAPDFTVRNLGADASSVGISTELLDKFKGALKSNEHVEYDAGNFKIYFYDYGDSYAFYLYGDDKPIYVQIKKAESFVEMIAVWE